MSRKSIVEYSPYLTIAQSLCYHRINLNAGHFINKGIELAAHSHPLSNLWLNTSYSYLHTSITNLTGTPRTQYFIGAKYLPISAVSISADLKLTL